MGMGSGITGAFTPSSKPLAHNFRPFRHYAPFHRSAFSQQAAPAPPEAKRLTVKAARSRRGQIRGVRGPAARGGPGGKGRQATRLGSGSAAPRAHLHELVLVEAQRVRPPGQFHPTFLHPAGRRLSPLTAGEGKKEDPVRTNLAAAARASCPDKKRHFGQHGSGRTAANQQGLRGPASAARPPPAPPRGAWGSPLPPRCRSCCLHAAEDALQLRQAGLGSLAPSEVGLRMKSTGWRSPGLPLQPPFPLGKIYLQHSSRISSLILPQGLAQIQVGGRKNLGSSLFLREHLWVTLVFTLLKEHLITQLVIT